MSILEVNVKKIEDRLKVIFNKYDLNTIDSLDFVNLIIELEENFQIEIDSKFMDISIFDKKNELAKYIESEKV